MILSESLKALKQNGNKSVGLFYSVLLLSYLTLVSVIFFGPVQSMMMKKFHPGVLPFGQWAMCQFLPSMYSFKNEIIVSPRLLPTDFNQTPGSDSARYSVNHYPMRIIYFSNVRASFFPHLPVYVYLRNTYRGREVVSSYCIQKNQNGACPILLNMHERN
ncbi:MAG: hypothetical protein JNN05_11470 [Candidatus Omnitrophica bacterium]|nr:hypothetical protein [Candidatus Omnitrophota bacterium]